MQVVPADPQTVPSAAAVDSFHIFDAARTPEILTPRAPAPGLDFERIEQLSADLRTAYANVDLEPWLDRAQAIAEERLLVLFAVHPKDTFHERIERTVRDFEVVSEQAPESAVRSLAEVLHVLHRNDAQCSRVLCGLALALARNGDTKTAELAAELGLRPSRDNVVPNLHLGRLKLVRAITPDGKVLAAEVVHAAAQNLGHYVSKMPLEIIPALAWAGALLAAEDYSGIRHIANTFNVRSFYGIAQHAYTQLLRCTEDAERHLKSMLRTSRSLAQNAYRVRSVNESEFLQPARIVSIAEAWPKEPEVFAAVI